MFHRTSPSLAPYFCALISLFTTTNLFADDLAAQDRFGQEGSVKLRLTDPVTIRQLESIGGRVIADYGAFTVLEAAASAVSQVSGGEILENENLILLNAGALDTTRAATKQLQQPRGAFDGRALHLVQFAGPIRGEWLDALKNTGVEIVTYIPSNAYLVYGEAAAIADMEAWSARAAEIQWQAPYRDEYKVDPTAWVPELAPTNTDPNYDLFAIQLVADKPANAATLAVIDRLKLAPIVIEYDILNYHNVIVRIDRDKLAELSRQPDIVSIQPHFPSRLYDERQDQIVAGNLSGNSPSGPGYLTWLGSKGFTQAQFSSSAFVVDVSDSPIDQGNTTPNHFGLWETGTIGGTSHIAYQRKVSGTTLTTPSPQKGCDGHGNINAHIVGGYDNLSGTPFADAAGYHYGLGVCPFVKVGGSGIFTTGGSYTNPNFTTLQSNAYNNGARISSNSWGNTSGNTYTTDSQAYDALVRDAQPAGSSFPTAGNQEMVIVFANGNNGPSANSTPAPATAKNIISVGAAENVQAFGGADGCGTTDSEANSANDMATFSSRGPCSDNRKKPDIVAPGTHVSGGVNQTASPGATGTADCFDGTGVCGGASSNYFPNSGQQFYTASSGTSHSAPAVAGGCALVRQFFINQSMAVPSPAMTKAFLMNSARYMNGTGANDTLWSNSQGMGEMNLGDAFNRGAVTPTIFRDQVALDTFTATGQTRTFTGTISDTTKPYRVTLAWTDAPGATSGAASKNNLDLTVTLGANTYRGNVFSGANSTTGGSADSLNNVESVFLPVGTAGSFTATVTATNINSDGVPNSGTATDQDFALVIYNATTAAVPAIAAVNSSLTSQSCPPGNGVIDPGESVSVDFTLQNVGTANTSNLVATLQATGGVTSPSAAQTYGALTAGGSAVTRSYSFIADGTCGSTLTATLQLQDGVTSLGTAVFYFTLGTTTTSFSQNFDGVTAPALPAGWVATVATGSVTAWATNSSVRDTLPNSVFAGDPSSRSDNQLASASFTVASASATLSFRHNYNTESTWDGGVLEISIAGGAYADFVTAGGAFSAGGYVSTLSSSTNPLTGRAAWNGNSGGFITTTGTFPASAVGQSVNLRWRMGSDGSVGGTGWYVDSITVSEPSCCSDPCGGGGPAEPSGPLATPASICSGASSTLSASVPGGVTVDWYSDSCGSTPVAGGAAPSVSPTSTTTYYGRARNTTSGCTSATCANVTVTVASVPAVPTSPQAAPSTLCPGGSSSLSASVPGGVTVDWYTGSCGGTLVSGGATPSVTPSSTTTYYARARNSTTGCTSATCANVTVTVGSVPAAPTSPQAAPSTICPGGASSLSASVPGGVTVDWYTGSCGGILVPGGATPSVTPSSTTTYYARARYSTTGCASATCANVTVTVGDAIPPNISQCASNQSANADAECQAAVPDFRSGVVATDNCTAAGSLVVSQSPPPGTLVGLGPTAITLTVTDAALNSSNCMASFQVNDATVPSFANCPADIGPVQTDLGLATAVVNWTPPTASDNCSTPLVNSNYNPGSAFGIGTTSVTYMATDGASNVGVCSFSVTVQDLEAPVIHNCPTTITIGSEPGTCTAVVSWSAPTVTDNAPGADISQVAGPASGSSFPVGLTSVQYQATDASANTALCSFDVIVTDEENPSFTGCPGNIVLGTDGVGCEAAAVWTAPDAADNCGIDHVSSSHNSGDNFPLGMTTVTYTATDINGREGTCSFTVTVIDDDSPTISTCVADQSGPLDENCQAALPEFSEGLVAQDNCSASGSLTISQDPPIDTLVGPGETTVTITVQDEAGNSQTCEATFTATSVMPPTINGCPSDVTLDTNAPQCGAVVTWDEPTVDDECPGASVSLTEGSASGSTFPPGDTTVTYTATDAEGLTSICAFTIHVVPTPDVNNNGSFGLDDIDPFVDVLIGINTNVPDIYRADVNCDGAVDGLDIEPFTLLLVGP